MGTIRVYMVEASSGDFGDKRIDSKINAVIKANEAEWEFHSSNLSTCEANGVILYTAALFLKKKI